MDLGERLYELRKQKGLSQEEVADRLGVTRQTVSKWETGQSTPDFDKVLPLCELYEISTEELFTGEKTEQPAPEVIQPVRQKVPENPEIEALKRATRAKTAKVVSVAVFIYIASIVVVSVGVAALRLDPVVMSGIMLLMMGGATALLIYHFMSRPKFAPTPKEKEEKTLKSRIRGIMALCVLVVYLLISFLTMAWHITWILWVVYALLCKIADLILMLKEEKKDEK